jgi:hypothetical protein
VACCTAPIGIAPSLEKSQQHEIQHLSRLRPLLAFDLMSTWTTEFCSRISSVLHRDFNDRPGASNASQQVARSTGRSLSSHAKWTSWLANSRRNSQSRPTSADHLSLNIATRTTSGSLRRQRPGRSIIGAI